LECRKGFSPPVFLNEGVLSYLGVYRREPISGIRANGEKAGEHYAKALIWS